MKQLIYYYDYDRLSFAKWRKEQNIIDSPRLLIEINFQDDNISKLKKLLKYMETLFPHATVVGMQSEAAFINQQVRNNINRSIISITEFESSTISSLVLDLENEYIMGQGEKRVPDIAKIEKCILPNTQAIQMLSNYNTEYSGFFIDEIGKAFNHLKIFGGGATSHSLDVPDSLLFHGNIIYKKAVVLIFMHGENLSVEIYKSFDWKPISKKKEITKIDDMMIYSIGESSALDIYRKYFNNIETNISAFLQVPIYMTKNNISQSVHILKADFEKQAIISAQPLELGDVVQLSIGDYNAMMNRIHEIYNFLSNTPAQSLWIGACLSYEYGFRIPLQYYISHIEDLNNIFGYMTSQEYFNLPNHPNTCNNHSFVLVAISESSSSFVKIKKANPNDLHPFEVSNKNLHSIMHKTASELNHLTENLEGTVHQRTKELEALNLDLQHKIDQAVRKEKKQNAIMSQQARLASMGEILENIAHQWRQPLNTVSWVLNDAMIKVKLGRGDDIDILELTHKINHSIQFLSDTIEDFRRFVDKSSDMPQTFNIKKMIESTILLIKETFIKLNINLELDCDERITFKGFENDLKHVVMNLINNSRDAFEEKKIEDGLILIKVYQDSENLTITVKDNAGGIPKAIIKSIFEPYFTTKHKTKGTGLGLYMSKQMIEKVNGTIEVLSVMNKKTTFAIKLPINEVV